MAKTINDEFMQQVVTEQAWKVLAEKYAWTEALLETGNLSQQTG